MFVFTPTATDTSIYESYQKNRDLMNHPMDVPIAETPVPVSNSKESFLQKKKEAADKRKGERQLKAMREEIATLEAELVAVTDELYGDAASDYMRAAELDERKTIIEDRLLQLYELTEE